MDSYYTVLINEFLLYLNANDIEFDLDLISLEQYWESQTTLKYLPEFALRILSIPVSQAEVERSFSIYRNVLTSSRENHKEENLADEVIFSHNKSIG